MIIKNGVIILPDNTGYGLAVFSGRAIREQNVNALINVVFRSFTVENSFPPGIFYD